METLAPEMIGDVWDRLTDSTPETVQALMELMAAEQPVLIGFLMAAEEDLQDEVEQGQLILLGTFIWQCFAATDEPVRQIKEEELDAAQDANVKMLESLSEESEMGYLQATEQMISNYNQMPLLGAVLESLMAEHAEEPDLAGENIGLAFIHLKSIIDCLDSRSR